MSTNWHLEYASLIIYDTLSNIHNGMTLREILLLLNEHSKYHRERSIEPHCCSNSRQLLFGPCGKIIVGSEQHFPFHYEWTIQTWQNYSINSSIMELNVPFDTYVCIHNSFSISEPGTKGLTQVARFCGRTTPKTYYLSTNPVVILLKATHLKNFLLNILNFQYEARRDRLNSIWLRPTTKERRLLFVTTLEFAGQSIGYVFFYTTNIVSQFVVKLKKEKKNCDVIIYDGPSSKSQSLTPVISDEATLQYISSLFCIAAHFKNIITTFSGALCIDAINVSIVREKTKKDSYNVSAKRPLDLTLHFNNKKGNVFQKIQFKVSENFLNIKLHSFYYRGSTEVNCYLGGVVFSEIETTNLHEPYCGEYGMSLITQKGLTFGS